MATSAQLLEAGAFLAPKVKLKDNDGIDTVSARSYSHPALAQPVVRLTADNLANGDDLMMEFLGFEEPNVTGPVAKQRRQALGFPGWALVNDPDHARYALELVKEFRKEIRRANSKPGHAWEGLMEIAKRLGKSVAHFLPSFWEQTGREFIAVGNSTYASRAFGKAREAEEVHGLKVDENLRQDSFLEFALAGCVSAKALTQYGKDLLAAHEPVAAWEFMKNLTVRRTLGGLPPWTNACKDLAPLIKAAGKDPKDELPELLELMIESPAMNRAAMGFWKSASPYIKVLAAKKPRVAGILLNMIPKSSSWYDPEIWKWLKQLQDWGVLENAWKSDLPEEAGPKDGAAAWFHRLIEANSRCPQIAFDTLTQMADRLIADGTELNLYTTYRWGNQQQNVNLDLLDLALSLKIPVADPTDKLEINLSEWASGAVDDKDARDRPRDPVFVKKDPRFSQALVDAVDPVAGDRTFERAATGKEALKEAREAWLMKTLDVLCGGGMPDFDDKQHAFVKKTRPETFQEFPKAAARLKKLDPLPALINTLKTFVAAEYCWPKLEEVVDSFNGPHTLTDGFSRPKNKLLICGSFPDAVVSDGVKAVVVRGDEVILETELKLPKNKKLIGLQYLDGDLKVVVKKDYQATHFWNSKPKVSETAWGRDQDDLTRPVLHMEGGGTFNGQHVIHAGDAKHLSDTTPSSFFHDGTNFWTYQWDEASEEQVFKEYDPETEKSGRKSLPAFFEDFAKHDFQLTAHNMNLHHFGDLAKDSPLGCKDGLVGFRIRSKESGQMECESIDGRKFEGTTQQIRPTGLLQQPATKKYLPVAFEMSYRGFEGEVFSADGDFRASRFTDSSDTYFHGHATIYPDAFWHVLKIRDLETSKQLRKITRKQVQALVDAATKDMAAEKPPKGEPVPVKNLNKAIKTIFPKLKDSRLQEGIRAIVLRYERRSRELMQQIENRDPKKQKAKVVQVFSAGDEAIISTVNRLGSHLYKRRATDLATGIATANAFFAGKLDSAQTSAGTVTAISALLHSQPSKVWKLFWLQEDQKDQEWRTCFDAVSQSGLCDLKGRFRLLKFDARDIKLPFSDPSDDGINLEETAFTWVKGSCRYLISKSWRSYSVLEYCAKTPAKDPLASIPNVTATEFHNEWSSDQLKSFLQHSKERLHQFPPLDFIKNLAGELNLSVAELSLIWFGFPRMESHDANFMPKHLRTAMKLKTKEASAAREALKVLEPETRLQIICDALDGDAAELWQDPPTAFGERLKASFKSSQPDLSLIPVELSDTFGKVLSYGVNRPELLKAFSSPDSHPYFSTATKWKFATVDGRTELTCDDKAAEFCATVLSTSALCCAWLPYVLPTGHASLQKLPTLYKALVATLNNPHLLISGGSSWLWELEDDKAREKLITASIGKPKRQKGVLTVDDGVLAAAMSNNTLERAFRPAKLKKPADYQKVQNQLDASATKEYVRRCDAVWLVELVRDAHFAAIIERLQSTKLEEGQYEANPIHSCPALVKKIAKAKKLSEEGAAYYLQLLCLPDPTDRNIKLWNSWTAAQMKKASAELLESELVLEAKRPRAGRKLFLPGGWEALKAPHLPLETWKLPLFRMYRDDYDRATPILPLIVPLQPVHELFAAGWKRITSGDEPRYEEV